MAATPDEILTLLDWKRHIFDVYRRVREHDDVRAAWNLWRETKDDLFKHHVQSPLPLEKRESFTGIPYFDYDPALRFETALIPSEPERYDITSSRDGTYSFTRFALARFDMHDAQIELEVYWLEAYGGGVFLPFRDATNGRETYRAGRYLQIGRASCRERV